MKGSSFYILMYFGNLLCSRSWNPLQRSSLSPSSQTIMRHSAELEDDIAFFIHSDIQYCKEPFKNFKSKAVKVPSVQREYVEERVAHFFDMIQSHYEGYCKGKNKDCVPYFGELSIGLLDGYYQIIDGQHRYRALTRFYETNNGAVDFNILYKLRICDDKDHLKRLFRELNNHYNLDEETLESMFAPAREKLIDFMKTNYKSHISNSLNPRFPNIHLDSLLQETFNRFGNLEEGEVLIQKLEEWNSEVGLVLQELHPNLYQIASQKQGFFLSYLFKKSSRERKGPVMKWAKFDGNDDRDPKLEAQFMDLNS